MSIRMLTLTAALLVGGGCVSYSYHSGTGGDYYSGTPSVEYRYVGGYYGYGYSPWYGAYGYPGYYGGYPYYGHRYHGYYGGYPYWGSPYYYGGGWGYRHGPYKPPPVTPPSVVTPPPGTVRYLDTQHDARRYPGHRNGAGGRYGVPTPPPSMADRGQYAPSRPISPPPSRPLPPPPQLISPPPSTPRVPPARPLPPTPVRAVVSPSSAGSEAKATPYSPKGATRSRSRYLDPNDP